MKIVGIKDQEDCFDGSIMKEVMFDAPLTRSFIDFLGEKGDLDYFPSFARPFFKAEIKGHYYVKGIENNTSASLILYKRNPKESLAVFVENMNEFHNRQSLNGLKETLI